MTQDHNKKSLRQFQCRDYLWEIFEQMGAELECSTDYLVNEAMRQYARSRNWGSRGGGRASVPAADPSGVSTPPSNYGNTTGSGMSAMQAAMPTLAPPRAGVQTGMSLPSPITSQANSPQAVRTGQATLSPGTRPPLPGQGTGRAAAVSLPPPLPGGGQQQQYGQHRGGMPSLFVIFNGQKVPVNKEEFVVGRGSKTADLAIKDGNISRRHAAIVLQHGAFYMKDLGSTNGVEFNGVRVDSRRIEEGDVYQMCDYELRFTYQP